MNKSVGVLRWVLFVSTRFATVDNRSRSSLTAFLSAAGICFGVMTLITVISVMNGFQMGYIESILEVSSYSIRANSVVDEEQFLAECARIADVTSVTPFYEAQTLMVGNRNKQQGVMLRAVDKSVMKTDAGFASQVKMLSGSFDLTAPDSIVLGSTLARLLGVQVGDTVNLLAMSGSADVELFSSDRNYRVTGIFYTGYGVINETFAFLALEYADPLFGAGADLQYGIKLRDKNNAQRVMSLLSRSIEGLQLESWQSFNRSFFGALQVEKNILMALVFLIFVVVGANIYNAMRRMVYERREEISVLSALGGSEKNIQSIFILQGFLIGIGGALPGLLLGLLISVRIDMVFELFAQVTAVVGQLVSYIFFADGRGGFYSNSSYAYYAHIPARILFSETAGITFFGVFSAVAAAWAASRRVLKMSVAEVLRDE